MEETHAQENERLLAPYVDVRNQLAHECLTVMLNNHHEAAGRLLADYQLACLAVDSATTLCQWFDDGVASEHIEIHVDQGTDDAASDGRETKDHR
jgi:hypothetical protein